MTVVDPAPDSSVDADATRLLFERTENFVCTLDLEGRFTSVNPAAEAISGYPADELVGRFATDLIAPGHRRAAVEAYRRRLDGEDAGGPAESVLLRRDGTRIPISVSSVVVERDGRPSGVLAIVLDLSERERATAALARSEEHFRALLEAAPDCMLIVDESGIVVFANERTEALFGYDRSEVVGRPVELLVPPGLRATHERHRAGFAETPQVRRMGAERDLSGRHKDGSEFPVEVSISPLQTETDRLVLASVRDVTDRKAAEEMLLESERRFRGSFEAAAIGIAVVAPEGRFLEVNQALCDIVGYDVESLMSRTFQEITHPDDLELDLDYVRRMLAGEISSYHLEKRYIHAGGAEVWVLLSVSLVRSADGEPRYFVAQVQDVDTRKRAVAELERRETELREAQQLAKVGSWDLRFAAGVVSMTPELREMYGLDAETEVTPELLGGLVHPADAELVSRTVARVLAPGQTSEMEFRVLLPDGTERWLYSRSEPIVEDGEVVGRRGIAQDISERRRAEQQLTEAERRYRTLVEQLPLAMYVRPLDLREPNIYVSPQVEPMLGYPAEAWLSDPGLLESIVHPDDRGRVVAEAARVRAGGPAVQDEYRYVKPDGSIVWVQDVTHLVCDEHGEPAYVQGFLRDITARKETEEERDRLRDELHHAQRLEALGRLAGGVAHDFNNMLTAIRGYGELLLEKLEPGAPGTDEAARILRAADQAADLPRQLLAFGRKQVLEPDAVDLNEVVASTAGLLGHVISGTITVECDLRATEPWTFADRSQLEHALVNLALNASDAMPHGGRLTVATENVTLSKREATERDAAPGPYVVVRVSDTGTGMDAETSRRAFEPFFTTKAQGDGSGLGLSSVYGTVAQSGGFVLLDTAEGAGTTFSLHLPAAAAPAADADDAAPGRAPTILLAEDEPIVRDLTEQILENAGFTVLAAADGEEALQLFGERRSEIAATVTDIVMPNLGGRELAERLREVEPTLPIVFISGYHDETPEALQLGAATALLQKPFSAAELVETLGSLVAPTDGRGDAALTCLVADDHPVVLDSVSRYLTSRGLRVEQAADGAEALAKIESLRPDVAVLDVSMTPLGGIDVARRAAETSPSTRTILYTGHSDRTLLDRAFEAGARGFVLKEAPLDSLADAVRLVAGGGTYVDPHLAGAVASPAAISALPPLTRREREILGLVADGLTNDKVAATLRISPETVQSHVRHAMVKLAADTRTEAVATALRHSLIS